MNSRGPGKIARRGYCENYKDTQAAMVWLHTKDGRRKGRVVKRVKEWKPDFGRARARPKSRWEELLKSTIGGGRSRIRSHGRESQKRRRQARH